MKGKSICHITTTPQTSIPRLLRESSTAVAMGIKPYIIAQGESYEEDGISFIGVKTENNRLKRMLFTSRQIAKEARNINADIYQIHDPELLPFALKFKKLGKAVIFDSHEFYGIQIELKSYIPKFLRKIVSKIYLCYESYICNRIDAVLSVCTIDGIDYFNSKSQRSVILSNLPDVAIFQSTSLTNVARRKAVIYAGLISESRGISNLLKAIESIECDLILCGPIVSGEYRNLIKGLPGYKKVDYRGVISRDEVIRELNKSSVGISTLLHVGQYSRIDTLPTKAYEYMAIGLPVIISNTAYAKKMVEEYKFGVVVDPYNIVEISEAIKDLITDEEKARTMGINGRKLAIDKYNWREEEKKLIRLYSDILSDGQ